MTVSENARDELLGPQKKPSQEDKTSDSTDGWVVAEFLSPERMSVCHFLPQSSYLHEECWPCGKTLAGPDPLLGIIFFFGQCDDEIVAL